LNRIDNPVSILFILLTCRNGLTGTTKRGRARRPARSTGEWPFSVFARLPARDHLIERLPYVELFEENNERDRQPQKNWGFRNEAIKLDKLAKDVKHSPRRRRMSAWVKTSDGENAGVCLWGSLIVPRSLTGLFRCGK
jgi:hypothetical protein